MVEVRFGKKNEPAVRFEKSDDLIVVRTRSQRSLREGSVPSPATGEIADGRLVVEFPEAGVEVYRVPVGKNSRSLDDRKKALRMHPDVRFAGGVFVDEKSGEAVIYTENLFVKFEDTADHDACVKALRDAGLTVKREVKYATNAFFVEAPEGTGENVFAIASQMLDRDDVEYCHPEVVRHRPKKSIFPQQWHLASTTINGNAVAASANVAAAHAIADGRGMTIAIIDDGVDIDHPEFRGTGKVTSPRDINFGIDDPRPKRFDEKHGTACAGVACANGTDGASGVAPKAALMPIRLRAGLGSQLEADAFEWAADHGADVISCSWGPNDGEWWNDDDPTHTTFVPLPASTKLAIDYAATQGRGGKGCVILFAAGNGRESVEMDGYASYERVIAVAACNDRGKRSVYSDFGDAVWCAFPSSDFGYAPFAQPEPLTPGIWTTDRMGIYGYNPNEDGGDAAGNYTNGFGGTSSACPGAAGVAALVLSVNPNLARADVRDILKAACDRVDPTGGEWANGRSPYYGWGRLNAETAVRLAAEEPSETILVARSFSEPINDLSTATVFLDVADERPIESLTVKIDIRHTYVGDLVVTLVPPAVLGVGAITLHNRAGGGSDDLVRSYTPSTTPGLQTLGGKSSLGRWTLSVRDAARWDVGTIRGFALEFAFGAAIRTPTEPVRRTARASSIRPAAGEPMRRPKAKAKRGKAKV